MNTVQAQKRMAYTFNGIGTTFYGQRDFLEDGSFITTEWLTVLYIPLIPFRSFRVSYQGSAEPTFSIGVGSTQNYTVRSKTRPNLKQVLFTYAFILFLGLWSTCLGLRFPHAFDSIVGLSLLIIVCLIPAPTPWILRYFAKRKLGAFPLKPSKNIWEKAGTPKLIKKKLMLVCALILGYIALLVTACYLHQSEGIWREKILTISIGGIIVLGLIFVQGLCALFSGNRDKDKRDS